MKKLIDWLLVREYRAAKDEASARIVRKQSRGSIAAQNGRIMSFDQLSAISAEVDAGMVRLNKAFPTAAG